MAVELRAPFLAPNTKTLLPNPVFGDVISPVHEINTKRSMRGVVRTYVKTNQRRRLQFDFNLSRLKALELEEFIAAFLHQEIKLTDHRDRSFRGFIINNPFELGGSRRAPALFTGNEEMTVQIIFEGQPLFEILVVESSLSFSQLLALTIARAGIGSNSLILQQAASVVNLGVQPVSSNILFSQIAVRNLTQDAGGSNDLLLGQSAQVNFVKDVSSNNTLNLGQTVSSELFDSVVVTGQQIEVMSDDFTTDIKITGQQIEVMFVSPPSVWASRQFAEVLTVGAGSTRASRQLAEVLTSV